MNPVVETRIGFANLGRIAGDVHGVEGYPIQPIYRASIYSAVGTCGTTSLECRVIALGLRETTRRLGMGLLRDRDTLSGAALVALGVFIYVNARQWDYYSPDGPGPGFFPVWYGLAMIALSLGLVVRSAVRPEPGARGGIDWPGARRALGTWAAFATTIALMQPLGFVVSFGLLTFVLVTVVFRKGLMLALVTAMASAVGFWIVFSVLLGVSLPAGTVWAPLLAHLPGGA